MQNVKKNKDTEAKIYTYENRTIVMQAESSEVQWDFVKAHYRDFDGDAIARNV